VKEMTGGTATIFVKRGDNFVRITSNVLKPDGSRDVGTVLDPDGLAIAAIHKGEAYYGVADTLEKPYITGCEPIRNSRGETIGVFYVGYPLKSLSGISEAMKDRGILESGFFALLNNNDNIVFRTENVPNPRELETVVTRAEQNKPVDPRWLVQLRTFAPWDYDVIAALYLPDVSAETFEIIWQVYGIGSVTILGVLVVSFLLASRLSDALRQAEMSRREALEALIEEAEDLNIKELTPDLNKIRAAGKHLLSLIDDVLDLSKIEAGKMTLFVEEINVESMIQDVATTIQPLIDKNANKLEIDISADCGTIRADLTKIRQTLLNLLSNASKFTEKGKITLAVRRVRGEAVLSSEAPTDSRTPSERIQFSVRDTGIGMTHEQQGKLFKAFSQTDASTTRKYGGIGLGLVISQRFCQLMGGDIAVRSEYGKGTTFTVDLPVEIAEISRQPSPPASEKSSGKLKLVLVIDDDHDAAEILKGSLSKAGYGVAVANDGAAGLEIARKQKPAAITLDVMMPGMDGWSVLTALKSDPTTMAIPVIMVTMLQDRHLGFTLGASEFLTKPVDPRKGSAKLSRPTAAAQLRTHWLSRMISAVGSSFAACSKRRESAFMEQRTGAPPSSGSAPKSLA